MYIYIIRSIQVVPLENLSLHPVHLFEQLHRFPWLPALARFDDVGFGILAHLQKLVLCVNFYPVCVQEPRLGLRNRNSSLLGHQQHIFLLLFYTGQEVFLLLLLVFSVLTPIHMIPNHS